jgi:hypothetical protein
MWYSTYYEGVPHVHIYMYMIHTVAGRRCHGWLITKIENSLLLTFTFI